MTNMEVILNMLAEASTTEISKAENLDGFEESRDVAKRGGNIAGNARRNWKQQLAVKSSAKRIQKLPICLMKTNDGYKKTEFNLWW